MNATQIMSRVRDRTHDRTGRVYGDREVLEAIDDKIRKLYTRIRTWGDQIALDNLLVPMAQLTVVESNVFQWKPPGYVGDLQVIEGKRLNSANVPIPQVSLENRDVRRGTFATPGLCWHWGPRNTIQVRGHMSGTNGLEVWYTRRLPSMVVLTTGGGGSATSIVPTGVAGDYKARPDVYVGMQFEGVSGTAANIGIERECTAYDGTTFTVDAFPATTNASVLAMVLPLPDEHAEYLIALVAETFFRRSSTEEEMALLQAELAELKEAFDTGIAKRSSGEPPRFSSSRCH